MSFWISWFSSFRFVKLALLTFGLMGFWNCAKHNNRVANYGTPDEALAFGVYSAQTQDANGFATKLSLNQNHTYSKKKFQDACLRMEYKGEWKYVAESVEFYLAEIRKRTDCNSEDWQIDKPNYTVARSIRKATTNSFELLDQEEDSAATWVKYLKR